MSDRSEINEHFATPTEQHLTVQDMASMTRMAGVEDPPEFRLVLDVVHDETGLDWRQEIAFKGKKMIELTQLMIYSCEQIGVDYADMECEVFIDRQVDDELED